MNHLTRHALLFCVPGLMLFILPVEGISLRLSWQLGAVWIAGALFTLALTNWWLRGFWVLALGQVVFGDVVLTSYVTLMMIAIFLLACEGFGRIEPEKVRAAIGVAGLLLTAWIGGQALGLVPKWHPVGVAAGPFNQDGAGVMLAMCLPAFFRGRLRWGLPAIGAALMWCCTTTGFAAALAAGIAYVVLDPGLKRYWLPAAVGMTALTAVFVTWVDPISTTIGERRWTAWKHTALSFRSDWNGRGLGSYAQIFPLLASGDRRFNGDGKYAWVQAHNEYLQTGFEMGLQVVALELAFLASFAATAWRRRKTMHIEARTSAAGVAAVAVSCLGWFAFHIAPLALVGVAWVGLWIKPCEREDLAA